MPSVKLGGARIDISGKSTEFEKAMKKASALFEKQERQIAKHRKQLARSNKAYATMAKNLKAIAGVAVGVALGALAKANIENAKTTAEWGSNLVKVSDRLDVLPSQLFAIQAAFEDDNIAITTTNQNLTALSRRFASDAPAMRKAAEKVGISLKEWDKTGGDLAKLLPIISKAMAGTATQAEKLNFLQEAGSTSARKFLTTLQRQNFDSIVEGYRSANTQLDQTAKKLEALDQLFTDIERREMLAVADVITDNIERYERFAQFVSDIKVAFISIAGTIGTVLEELDKKLAKAEKFGNKHVAISNRDFMSGIDDEGTSEKPLEIKINSNPRYGSSPRVPLPPMITGKEWKRMEEEGKKAAEKQKKLLDGMREYQEQVWSGIAERAGAAMKDRFDRENEAILEGIEKRKHYEEQYAKWVEETQMRIAEANIEQIERQEQAMEDFVNSIQVDLFDLEQTFKNVLNRMAEHLIEFAITGKSDFISGLVDFFGGLLGGGGGYSSPGNPHIDRKSSGGRIYAGERVRVGELGAEEIVPLRDGYVIPNHQLRSGGMSGGNNVTTNFTIIGGDERGVETALRRNAPKIERAIMANIMDKAAKNTAFRGTIARAPARG